jgi:hypothetical protein
MATVAMPSAEIVFDTLFAVHELSQEGVCGAQARRTRRGARVRAEP